MTLPLGDRVCAGIIVDKTNSGELGPYFEQTEEGLVLKLHRRPWGDFEFSETLIDEIFVDPVEAKDLSVLSTSVSDLISRIHRVRNSKN